MQSLGAQALAPVAERLDAEAEAIVGGLVGRGVFDAVPDFSSGLPLQVVADLVGVRVSTERLLSWGTISFDVLGPLNRRGLKAAPSSLGMLAYSQRLSRSRVVPGSWAASVFEAADRGEIDKVEARNMVIDFIAPSLDTTILAATHMLWLLGENPEAWQRIRQDPELIPAAVVEAVRIASPIRGFTRQLSRDAELGGVRLPAGDRVVLLFGAANLDERRYPRPGALRPRPPARWPPRLGQRSPHLRRHPPRQAGAGGAAAGPGRPGRDDRDRRPADPDPQQHPAGHRRAAGAVARA